jgi:hypothetical protein
MKPYTKYLEAILFLILVVLVVGGILLTFPD